MRGFVGRTVHARGRRGGPARRAASALAELGVDVRRSVSRVDEILDCGRGEGVVIAEWRDELGPIAAEYLGLIAAGEVLGARRDVHARRVSGSTEGASRRHRGVSLVRCADSWLVARWRDPAERRLLRALVGPLASAPARTVWTAARDARLLVSPIRPSPRIARPVPRVLGEAARGCASSDRVVDWTNLWAGPWATGELAREGVPVVRIEAPTRRDGYVRTRAGRARWRRWNGRKRLALIDVRDERARSRLGRLLATADALVFGQTPRVLPQLGFDEAWFARRAPHLFRLSLVAYEDPLSDQPGLGENATALSGLLWRGEGARPAPPYPWADPLLGAWALLVLRAHRAAPERVAGHWRLSLEAAAARVMRNSEA